MKDGNYIWNICITMTLDKINHVPFRYESAFENKQLKNSVSTEIRTQAPRILGIAL